MWGVLGRGWSPDIRSTAELTGDRGRMRTILPTPPPEAALQPGPTTAPMGLSGGRLCSSHHVALSYSWGWGSPRSALALLPFAVLSPRRGIAALPGWSPRSGGVSSWTAPCSLPEARPPPAFSPGIQPWSRTPHGPRWPPAPPPAPRPDFSLEKWWLHLPTLSALGVSQQIHHAHTHPSPRWSISTFGTPPGSAHCHPSFHELLPGCLPSLLPWPPVPTLTSMENLGSTDHIKSPFA